MFSGMKRVLEDIHVHWVELVKLAMDESHERWAKAELRNVVNDVCRLFTLCITTREKEVLEDALRAGSFPIGEEVANLLQRCSKRRIPDVDVAHLMNSGCYPSPEPSIAVTSVSVASLLPKRVGATDIFSTAEFPFSLQVERARQGLVQVYSLNTANLASLWDCIIRPVSRASHIYLTDPYVISNYLRHGRRSGLAFLMEKWGEMAQNEGRKMMISILSAHGGNDIPAIAKSELEAIVDELVAIGQFNAVRVRLVDKKQNPGHIHARNLLAFERSAAIRGLVFDDSIPQKIDQRSDKLQTVAMITHRSELDVLERGFNDLRRHANLDVAKAPKPLRTAGALA